MPCLTKRLSLLAFLLFWILPNFSFSQQLAWVTDFQIDEGEQTYLPGYLTGDRYGGIYVLSDIGGEIKLVPPSGTVTKLRKDFENRSGFNLNRISPTGELIFSKPIEMEVIVENDFPFYGDIKMAVDTDDNLYMTGHIIGPTTVRIDGQEIDVAESDHDRGHILMLKFNDSGDLLNYSLIKAERAIFWRSFDMAISDTEIFMLSALVDQEAAQSSDQVEFTHVLQVFDFDFNLKREKRFTGTGIGNGVISHSWFLLRSLVVDQQSNVYLGGITTRNGISDLSSEIIIPDDHNVSILISLNSELEFRWFRGLATSFTAPPRLKVLSDGQIIFNAYTSQYSGSLIETEVVGNDFDNISLSDPRNSVSRLLAFDASGALNWSAGLRNLFTNSMGVDSKDNIYLSFGSSRSTKSNATFISSNKDENIVLLKREISESSAWHYGFQKISKEGLDQGVRFFNKSTDSGFVDNMQIIPALDCGSFILSGRYNTASDLSSTIDLDFRDSESYFLKDSDSNYNHFLSGYSSAKPEVNINESNVENRLKEWDIPFEFEDDSYRDVTFSTETSNPVLLTAVGAQFDIQGTQGVLTLQRTGLQAGTVTVKIIAEDDCGNISEAEVNIELDKIDPIEILSTPATEVLQGENYVYPIETTNTEGGIEFTRTSVPDWLSFVNNGSTTGVISRLAGTTSADFNDGTGADVRFNSPKGLVVGPDSAVYVADRSNQRIRRVSKKGEVTTYAGTGDFGNRDGHALTRARFSDPVNLVFDSKGNLFVVEESGSRIRKITPNGDVSTFAGYWVGFKDGIRTSARFDSPVDIVIDGSDNLFVADLQNRRIRKITPEGEVSTYAGTGNIGDQNGNRLEATFDAIVALAIDLEGNLYLSDGGNNKKIKKISPDGIVTTIAENVLATGLEIAPDGRLLANDIESHSVVIVNSDGTLEKLAGNGNPGVGVLEAKGTENPAFFNPTGIAASDEGFIYIADAGNQMIKRFVLYGRALFGNTTGINDSHNITYSVENVLGNSDSQSFTLNVTDITGPNVLAINRHNPSFEKHVRNRVVFEVVFNERVQSVDREDFRVNATGDLQAEIERAMLHADGRTTEVVVKITEGTGVLGLELDDSQDIADIIGNSLIDTQPESNETYLIENTSPQFVSQPVTTVNAGLKYEYHIKVDDPDRHIVDLSINLFNPISDYLALIPSYSVSTLVGSSQGDGEGGLESAMFNGPSAVATDNYGNIYIGDSDNHKIKKITPDGEVFTIAGSTQGFADGQGLSAQFGSPLGIAIDSKGNLFVVDPVYHSIRKVDQDGHVTTFAGKSGVSGYVDATGTEALFSTPTGIAIDGNDNLYVADQLNHRIRKLSPEGEVTTISGGDAGYVDGNKSQARFNAPASIAIDESGQIFVTERLNHTIRKIDVNGVVSTIAGDGQSGDIVGENARFNLPFGIVIHSSGEIFVVDRGNHKVKKIATDGTVGLVAGGDSGESNGYGVHAQFNGPLDLTILEDRLLVTDNGNERIREISLRRDLLTGQTLQNSSFSTHLTITAEDKLGAVATQTFQLVAYNGSAPEIEQLNPVSGSISQTTTLFEMQFSKNIYKGQGNLELRDFESDEVIESIPVGSDKIQITDRTVSIQTEPYPNGKLLYWYIPGTALTDGLQDFAGIADPDHWKFASSGNGVAPFVISIERLYPEVETHKRSKSYFKVSFNKSVHEPSFTDFEISPSTTGGRITSLSRFSGFDSYQISVEDYNEGELGLIIPESNQIVDNAGMPFSGKVLLSETFTILNNPPEFISEPSETVKDTEVYSHQMLLKDHERDGFSLEGTQLPGWLKLVRDSTVYVSTFIGPVKDQFNEGQPQNFKITEPQYAVGWNAVKDVEVAVDGSVYVAYFNTISKLANGELLNFVGEFGGYKDGVGAEAQFFGIRALSSDEEGNLYVADGSNYRIRKVTPEGVVTTLAGSGISALEDGLGEAASFLFPRGVKVKKDGSILVTDRYAIRNITADGEVTTIAGTGSLGNEEGLATTSRIGEPSDVIVDSKGNIFFSDYNYRRIKKIDPDGILRHYSTLSFSGSHLDGPVSQARFSRPFGLAMDGEDNLYVTDASTRVVRMISNGGYVSTLAGSIFKSFYRDGPGSEAVFESLGFIETDIDGNLLVVDRNYGGIRKLTFQKRLEGDAQGQLGLHHVSLKATDHSGAESTRSFTIEVVDGTPPLVTSESQVLVEENTEGVVYTVTAEDPTVVTYELAEQGDGSDEALFTINSTTGELLFKTSPDFENPQDSDGDNKYELSIYARNAKDNTAEFSLTIGVTNLNEHAPVFTSTPVTSVRNDELYRYEITTGDADGDLLEYSAELPSWLTLNQKKGGTTSTFAGSVLSVTKDGQGTDTGFYRPAGITIDGEGNIYVSDTQAHRIRKISPAGEVTTIAGSGNASFADGTAMQASFNQPQGLAVDNEGNIFVADSGNERIRKITPERIVTTVAGSGIRGTKDGIGTEADLGLPWTIAVNNDGVIYFVNGIDQLLRKVDTDGYVSAVQVNNTTHLRLQGPADILTNDDGSILVADTQAYRLYRIESNGDLSVVAGSGIRQDQDGTGISASFVSISSMGRDDNGNVYLTDNTLNTIRKIDSHGAVTTVMGPGAPFENTEFESLRTSHMTVTPEGDVYFIDIAANTIMKFVENTSLSVFAGGSKNTDFNGDLQSAKFHTPVHAVYDQQGSVYVTDYLNHVVRKISVDGEVTTLAGSGTIGDVDGQSINAAFKGPWGIAVDSQGNLFVSDLLNHKIRKINPEGEVSTFAGNGTTGFTDGEGITASFNHPRGIVIDEDDNLFVADSRNNSIRKITPDGLVSTVAGTGNFAYQDGTGTEAAFAQPYGLDVDKEGNLWVADASNSRIRKIDTNGIVTTVAGSGERLIKPGQGSDAAILSPVDIVRDAKGNMYVAAGSTYIWRIDKDLNATILAGGPELAYEDGEGMAASFRRVYGLELTPTGDLLAVDANNHRIRHITLPSASLSGDPQGLSGEHAVIIEVTDGFGHQASQQFNVNVIDVVAPVFNSDSEVSFEENSNEIVYQANVTDESTITFSLATALDEALFDIDANTGEISFKESPDFEAPSDHDTDNKYNLTVIATDANDNTAELAITIEVTDLDEIRPTITITSDESVITNKESFEVTIQVSENTNDLSIDDFTVDNATLSVFASTGADFSVTLTPLADGNISLKVEAEKFTDEAGNPNEESNEFAIVSDRTAPIVTLNTEETDPTNAEFMDFVIGFSSDITFEGQPTAFVDNGAIVSLTGQLPEYTLRLTPGNDGTVTITIPSLYSDPAGNLNAEVTYTIESDRTGPEGVLTGPGTDLVNQAFTITLDYDEQITGFDLSDLEVNNGTASSLSAVIAGQKWEIDIEPTSDGAVQVELPQGVVLDLAGNANSAVEVISLVFDGTVPEVTSIERMDANPLEGTSGTFRVLFSEDVTGVNGSDFELAFGGAAEAALGTVTAIDAKTYDVTISDVSGGGSIGLDLKDDDSIADLAGNVLGGTGVGNGDFSGEIYDTNSAPTGVLLSNSNIAENNEINVLVGNLSAVDPDESDTHTFALVSGQNSEDNDNFTINGSELLAAVSFDFETKNIYRIRVKVTDNSSESFEEVLTITVSNVGEPTISLNGSLDFGMIDIGSTATLVFDIVNSGDGVLEITSLSFPEGFASDFANGDVPASGTQSVTVTFSPTENIEYTGEIVVSSSVGSASILVSGEGQLVTSLDDDVIEPEEVALYPNPVRKEFTVDLIAFKGRPVNISIQDLSGRTRFTRTDVREQSATFDISSYEEGMFILLLNDGQQKVYKKFMIRR